MERSVIARVNDIDENRSPSALSSGELTLQARLPNESGTRFPIVGLPVGLAFSCEIAAEYPAAGAVKTDSEPAAWGSLLTLRV